MRQIPYRVAIREALREEMLRDPKVMLIGEDIGRGGGAFGVTKGLFEEFGEQRVIDTPISEESIVGLGIGLALAGYRPVIEIMFSTFMTLAIDPIVNLAAALKTVSSGKISLPLVIRTLIFQGGGAGHDHSMSYISWFLHVPGLKIAVPTTSYDAKGLLKSAIRGDEPCIFFEHFAFYPAKENLGQVPEEDYTLEFGKSRIAREGDDLTLVAISAAIKPALAAAEELSSQGISCEVLDPRTLAPLDKEGILNSVRKTGRLMIAEVDPVIGGVGAEIAAIVAEQALDYLDAPIKRLGQEHVTLTFSNEPYILVTKQKIIEAVKQLVS